MSGDAIGGGPHPVGQPDSPVFRSNVWALLVPPATAAAAVVIFWLLFTVLVGRNVAWQSLVMTALTTAVGALIGNAVGTWRRRGQPVWVRVSPAGIEMAPHGQAVLVAWGNIVTARVRRRGLLTALEVVPVDLYALRTDQASRNLPRLRYPAGRATLSMDVGLLRPGPAVLRAEIDRGR
jgi:hypothetical protein